VRWLPCRLSAALVDTYNSAMLQRLLRWLAPLLFALPLAAPLHAQPKDPNVPPADLRRKDDASNSSSHVPVFEFMLALGGTAVVLFILCMPSRKR
jgi:hypothetical protein